MTERLKCDVCVIGAGSGGLSAAFITAQLGARTVLFEKGEMGGECLNTGCVPSKALLAAARSAAEIRNASRFGITAVPDIRFSQVMDHVRRTIAAIAPHDSVGRFEKLGVKVIRAQAQFTGRNTIAGGGYDLRARRIIIATGSRPAIPPIPGLDQVPYLTNETIFSLHDLPRHLLIVGAGPEGAELAQAFARLGSSVTLFESDRLLAKDETDLVDRLRRQLTDDAVALREHTRIANVSSGPAGVAIALAGTGERVSGSHLLVAAGREANPKGLALERAGIRFDQQGIIVDARLRTTQRHVYAIGDAIAGAPRFTHAANYQAQIAAANALVGWPAKADYRLIPSVTYTDPELAHLGMTESEARAVYGNKVRVITEELTENDRAQTDAAFPGAVKLIAARSGKIVGVSILAPHAGEMIQPWALALANGLRLSAFLKAVMPYPTLGEISKTAAQSFYLAKLFSRLPKIVVRLRLALG
jgi:pyruvate/2-oxoglutarate dehydrogenase complex dihydrolipoamide dehydrogenase (E3) component